MHNMTTVTAALLALSAVADVMSPEYRKMWSDEVIAEYDRDIEKYRKADGAFKIDAETGTKVSVEQLSHAFRFGAHSFRIGRLSSEADNRRYEKNFAALFNQATIAFYWRDFEPQPGNPHFHTHEGDLESAFTSGTQARMDAHSRYLSSPARSTDQFIEFAKSHGMSIHGHPLVWASAEWNHPFWLYEQFCPPEEQAFLRLPRKDPREITRLFGEVEWIKAWMARMKELFDQYTEEEIAARCPVYLAALKAHIARHIAEIMDYCGSRVDSWDVVNECAVEYPTAANASRPMTKSTRHMNIMPADYVAEAYRVAAAHASPHALLSVNDYYLDSPYAEQVSDMLARGLRVNMIGMQIHVFADEDFNRLVAGGQNGLISTPNVIRSTFGRFGALGLPIHVSEITLPSPGSTPESLERQAIVAANLYRAWFAQRNCRGITWWHTLDGADSCGGCESGSAGVCFADGSPKPVYHALYDLIHRRWRTVLETEVAKGGEVCFRGFRGDYRLSWKDADGKAHESFVTLK